MDKMEITSLKVKGKLKIENSQIFLESDGDRIIPIPFSKDSQLSSNHMLKSATSTFKSYLDRVVTIAGIPEGNTLYEAKLIRTREDRDPNVGHVKDYWDNRVPKADIMWRARRLPQFPHVFSVDVRQMITLNDSVIEKDIREHDLTVVDPEECNDDIFLIYKHSRLKDINPYNYVLDGEVFGCEFFMYPYELREVGRGDCDDWGIELASYLISAGVPEWRVRCVVGTTYEGEGHLTVYVLADDLASWHHINSTTPWWKVEEREYTKLTDFPKTDDNTDTIGIEDIWFSFNNQYAWHAFETHASDSKAKKIPWFYNFRIVPRFD